MMHDASSPGSLSSLLTRRERGLTALTLLCALLFLGLAMLLLPSSPPGVGAVGAGAGAPALAGGLWAAVTLWVVAWTRAEGEPPDLGPTLLLFGVSLQALAVVVAGGAMWQALEGGQGWGLLWLALAAVGLPWRALLALSETDPGHRIERLWRLHGVAGRLLAVGMLAPSVVVLAAVDQGQLSAEGALPAAAPLALLVGCGVALAGVAARLRPVGAALDQVRLAMPDLPPQPDPRWLPRGLVVLGGLALAISGLRAVPWPASSAVQAHLVHSGWLAPEDGRSRWMVLESQDLRLLTRAGAVQARFSPRGGHIVATASGDNPAFWVLWEGLSWYPQQIRDVWDVTEVALSPDGETVVVGRRHGALQLRALPSGKARSAWTSHTWAPLSLPAPGGRLHYAGETPLSLSDAQVLLAWQAEDAIWLPLPLSLPLQSPEPIQGFVPSPAGDRLALVLGSRQILVVDAETGALQQRLEARGVRRVLWTPEGAGLLLAGQGVERVRLADGARTRLYDAPTTDIALAAGGALAIASHDVRVVDAETGALLLAATRPQGGAAHSVSWDPTGAILAVGTHTGTLELWHLREHRATAAGLTAVMR